MLYSVLRLYNILCNLCNFMEEEKLTEEQAETNRARLFSIILYEDTKSYDFKDVLRSLKSYKKYAYIKHRPEKDEKKEHYHFIIRTDNPITIKTLCKKTGVPKQHVKKIRNERSMCRYLIHQDDEDKIKYNLEDVNVSKLYKNYYYSCFDDLKTEEEKILHIIQELESLKSYNLNLRLQMFILFLNTNYYYTIYNRYKKLFDKYLYDMI